MKFLILMFLVLAIQISLVSSETAAQEAYISFMTAVFKHASQRNPDIVHADYEQIDRNGVIATKSKAVQDIKEASSEDIASFAKSYQDALTRTNWPWKSTKVEFTRDGLLHIKNYDKYDGTISSVWLAKHDSSIEGGYKVYRVIIL